MSTVKPALTEQEWGELMGPGRGEDEWGGGDHLDGAALLHEGRAYVYHEGCYAVYFIADRHSCAALCLHGIPEGFTHADVENHQLMAEQAWARHTHGGDPYAKFQAEWHDSMANRLSALLPPEAP